MAARIELALPNEFLKQFETEVYEWIFSEKSGAEIRYSLCLTTYFTNEPVEIIGLHTEALIAVFPVSEATLIKEFDSHDHAGAIYSYNGDHYACTTISPAGSAVITYDPNTVTEADAIKIIRSIYQNPESDNEVQ